jgi:hypothetical protein
MSNKQKQPELNPPLPTTVCRQKVRLVEAYEAANAQFSKALAELTSKLETSTRLEYVSMYRATEILRKDADDYRHELELHVRQHGC